MCRHAQSAKLSAPCLILALLVTATTYGADMTVTAADDDMRRLEGGAFTMGSDQGLADERPAHAVSVKSFAIDRRPVTNAEFAEFLSNIGEPRNANGQNLFDWDDSDARIHKIDGLWQADPGFALHPVIEASWYGARDYCLAKGKRLPTEAEWEFAARGAIGRTYPWGEAAPTANHARFASGYGQTIAAGSLPDGATPEGVLDLTGNVHQWTASIAAPYPYRADDGREDPDRFAERVTRGGAADTRAETLRATWRGATVSRGARAGHHNIGFRCAKDAD